MSKSREVKAFYRSVATPRPARKEGEGGVFDASGPNAYARLLGLGAAETGRLLQQVQEGLPFGAFETRALIRPGDVVIMQFGHNDTGAVNDATRARASLRGVGEETQDIDNLLTHQRETVHTYGWYLKQYIADARARRRPDCLFADPAQELRAGGQGQPQRGQLRRLGRCGRGFSGRRVHQSQRDHRAPI